MSRNTKLVAGGIFISGLVASLFLYLQRVNIPVLQPAGPIGQKERDLIILAVVLSLIVVIPVYFMLVTFAWRYRESNKKAKYEPEFDHSRLIEAAWWGVPIAIITGLAIATWHSSHELDPPKPLASSAEPVDIQVVALQWRWLFIYPEQKIASINLVQFPEKTPIKFHVTADAPMNSFWIPQLGSQIYAMSGMSTNVHLMADSVGSYQGSSANISGEGFAKMRFTANSLTRSNFDRWVSQVQQFPDSLDMDTYKQLAKPSRDNTVNHYALTQPDLYSIVVNKYLSPGYHKQGAAL
jgi:cytochrome o ubiquinol oxidase subunit 2